MGIMLSSNARWQDLAHLVLISLMIGRTALVQAHGQQVVSGVL